MTDALRPVEFRHAVSCLYGLFRSVSSLGKGFDMIHRRFSQRGEIIAALERGHDFAVAVNIGKMSDLSGKFIV